MTHRPIHLFRRPSWTPALLLLALLSACGDPQPGPALQAKFPYLPGVNYGWSDVQLRPSADRPWSGPLLRAQGGVAETYISDLTWTAARSGYGAVELNRSNGEYAAGDGGPLTLGGVSFAHGLGLHAASDVAYALQGCSTFVAQVGVDDEVGNLGSVVFQVWSGAPGNGTKLYDSGRLTGADAARAVSVNVNGVTELHLVVTDAGDNPYYDHADWADARLSCGASVPSGEKFVSDLTPTAAQNGWGPYEPDRSNGERPGGDGRGLSLRGVQYQKGLGVHASSSLSYALGGLCSTFTATVGVDDEVGGRGRVNFAVFGDNDLLYSSGPLTGQDAARSVNVSVAGMNTLRLAVGDGGDGLDYDHADWAAAKLTCTTTAPTVTAVSVSPAALSLTLGASAQLSATVSGTGAYDPAVTWSSSDAGVLNVSSSGLVTAVSLGTATVTAASVAAPSQVGRAAVTVTAASTLPPGGVRVNFQPAGSAVPAGFTADTGAAYTDARGHGWITQASAGSAGAVPLDLTPNTRDRAVGGVSAQQNTLIHLQHPGGGGNVSTPGAWEYAVPAGTYTVTVSVGDAADNVDSTHLLNIEGKPAFAAFVPTPPRHFYGATLRVPVTDGKLTIDARGGVNTKLDWVVIEPGDRPSVRVTVPQDGERLVNPAAALTADVNLVGGAIDLGTLNAVSVQLREHAGGGQVMAQLNTSGGGDVVVLRPTAVLKANTQYDFIITDALKDVAGVPFLPSTRSFVTGSPTTSGGSVAFEQVNLPGVPANPYTAVELGPDHRLYAATLTGKILRFEVLPDGTLGSYATISSVTAAAGGPRSIIGLKFDPSSTADNLVLWITNNAFWNGQSPAPDWSGKLTRLSGPALETVQDYVVDLPRSTRDHMTNGLTFNPLEPGVLYLTQGSNSAMGAPDAAWGNRPEHLLNAAVLRLDLSKLGSLPLSVKTEDGGLYDPYAPGAPLTIYGSGVRNAYRLLWAGNGQLYAPTNGSAAGGNTPGTPANFASLP